jgi:polysaccharide biosynthesis protein PslG
VEVIATFRRRLLPFLLLAAALSLPALLPQSARAAEVGVVGDITWVESRADIDREVELMRSAGVRWMRANVNWKGLEPDAKGDINEWLLDQYDYAIDRAHAAGIEILMPISDGVPYWASGDPRKSGGRYKDTYPPANMADYGDIVRFVVEHFSARGVHAFEIWNEPNLSRFWAPQPDAGRYVEMLKAGHRAVKGADPQATVLLGGLSKNDFEYLEDVYRAGGGPYFDAVAVHPYTYGVAPDDTWNGVNAGEDPDRLSWNSFPALTEVKATMDQFGDSAKQVWITEFGYSTTSEDGGVSEDKQARYLTESFEYVERLPWVHSMFWYGARNSPFYEDEDTYEGQFGLMSADFRLKPSYSALAEYAQSAPGATGPGSQQGRGSSGESGAPATGEGSRRSAWLPLPRVTKVRTGRKRVRRATARATLRVSGKLPRALLGEGRLRLRFERRGHEGWRPAGHRRVRLRGESYGRRLSRRGLKRGFWRVAVVVLDDNDNVVRGSRNRYFRL